MDVTGLVLSPMTDFGIGGIQISGYSTTMSDWLVKFVQIHIR